MELKAKLWKWSAGIPVVMLNQKTASEIGVHPKDRISIRAISHPSREISTIVDIMGVIVKKNEIAVSSEIKEILNLKEGQKVDVNLADAPKSLNYIKEKLDKKKLSKDKIEEIIKDVMSNSLSEAEIALFISAMHNSGMDMNEIVYLTNAILDSGNKLNLRYKVIADKHSIGGIAGNRTTPIVVSICAAAGLIMPKTSSRAITSAAGTADVIETIAKIDFSVKEIKRILKQTNACMVGGELGIVPADSKIIRIEKELKIDPQAQLIASIMSKKLAVGSSHILIDIPYGKTAKVSKKEAVNLKKKFEQIGRRFNKKLNVVLTDGSQPIGNGIGPALELLDIIAVLDQKKERPKDLEKKALFLAGELLELTGVVKKRKGIKLASDLLYSGKAFAKFKQIIKAQKGSLDRANKINLARFSKDIVAKKTSRIKEIDNKKINYLSRVLGCPIDKFSGIYLYHHVGEKVKKGQNILTIYSESKERINQALRFYMDKKPIKLD